MLTISTKHVRRNWCILLTDMLGKDRKSWVFSNFVKTEEFSDFKSFLRFLESSLWLRSPHFHGLIRCWKGWKRRIKGFRLKSWPWMGALGGRGRAWSLESGTGTRRTTQYLYWSVDAFRVQRRLAQSGCQVPSNGCKLRSVVKICLFLCITDRPDPVFSELFMEAFRAVFAEHENG